MHEADYRAIVEECVEFGWLNHYQDEEFRLIERETLLPALGELRSAQQVLAAVFLQNEFLEPGVALAPSGSPLPEHDERAEPPEAVVRAIEVAAASQGQILLGLSPDGSRRHAAASSAAALARRKGFSVLRAVGRRLADGRLEPVYEALVTEALEALPPEERRDFCVHRGQYLQLMAPLEHFPVRPGGVFNTDPGLNRLKLNKAFLELLLRLMLRGPLCLLAEEAHLFPRLGLEALAYLAWILKNGTMGISGLGEEDRTLDTRPFLLVMTAERSEAPHHAAWVQTLSQRRVPSIDLA